ncbi:MAG TPA: hypothetical protein VN887_14130, partial [Candidatus Angelobacter sp.]|nr:hypothetical protein [Candidatus Angelobacter sp.]
FQWVWLDIGCLAFIGGLLTKVFLKNLNAHPIFPQKDPRLAEGLDIYVPPAPTGNPASSPGGAE